MLYWHSVHKDIEQLAVSMKWMFRLKRSIMQWLLRKRSWLMSFNTFDCGYEQIEKFHIMITQTRNTWSWKSCPSISTDFLGMKLINVFRVKKHSAKLLIIQSNQSSWSLVWWLPHIGNWWIWTKILFTVFVIWNEVAFA